MIDNKYNIQYNDNRFRKAIIIPLKRVQLPLLTVKRG